MNEWMYKAKEKCGTKFLKRFWKGYSYSWKALIETDCLHRSFKIQEERGKNKQCFETNKICIKEGKKQAMFWKEIRNL